MIVIYEFLQLFLFSILRPFIKILGSEKAKLFMTQRDTTNINQVLSNIALTFNPKETRRRIWVHVASAGELEQAIPPLRHLVETEQILVFLTYYSPSTVPFLKNASFASAVLPFPLDVRKIHLEIIRSLKITDIMLVRYDFWPSLFNAAKSQNVSLHLLGGTALPSRKATAKLFAPIKQNFLNMFHTIFAVSSTDVEIFQSMGLPAKIVLAGDPKWSRALERAQKLKASRDQSKILWLQHYLEKEKTNRNIIVFGSPHKEEHNVANELLKHSKNTLLIYASHECGKNHIDSLVSEFSLLEKSVFRFSELDEQNPPAQAKMIIVDKIGFLAELYASASIAIVGGGFDGQIHNVLEPAAHPVPTAFGCNVSKAREALLLLEKSAAIGFSTPQELLAFLLRLDADEPQSPSSPERATLLKITHEAIAVFHNAPNTTQIVQGTLSAYWNKAGHQT